MKLPLVVQLPLNLPNFLPNPPNTIMIHKNKTRKGKEKIKKLTVKLFHEKRKENGGIIVLSHHR
jgi:hypothetical protein